MSKFLTKNFLHINIYKITNLENQFTRKDLYNILKKKNIERYSRLQKHDLIKKVIEYQHHFAKPKQRISQFRFGDNIFSNEKSE